MLYNHFLEILQKMKNWPVVYWVEYQLVRKKNLKKNIEIFKKNEKLDQWYTGGVPVV